MGKRAVNQVIDTRLFKEVLEHQTYIFVPGLILPKIPPCDKCGNEFKKGERITKVQTNKGVEYFHADTCLKGVEFIGENKN